MFKNNPHAITVTIFISRAVYDNTPTVIADPLLKKAQVRYFYHFFAFPVCYFIKEYNHKPHV